MRQQNYYQVYLKLWALHLTDESNSTNAILKVIKQFLYLIRLTIVRKIPDW